MKRTFTAWLVGALWGLYGITFGAYPDSSATPPPSDQNVALKLLTWNIQLLPAGLEAFSSDLDKLQLTRVPWIVEFLNQSDYDVVCLQEVLDPTATNLLVNGLRATFPHIVMPPKDPARLLSSGVLFAARVPIEQVDFVCYPDCSGVDCLASKGLTIIRGEKNGRAFMAAGTHLQAGSQTVRDRQYQSMADAIARHRKDHIPMFVMGDFNTAKGEPPYEQMLSKIAVRDFPVDDPKPYSVDAENSWKDSGQRPRLIDHIFLNPGVTGTTITRQTVQRARRNHQGKTIDLADHYGIVAESLLMAGPEK
ncbi:MAG TPA: endonuclease/exonuclease/phosphatase family protein [Candidatus Hydrogenedentes bacterium]|nr:endonuclease/exonuclease/phosphatase family protein [Candidatus Hydrogenedentota bacterium]